MSLKTCTFTFDVVCDGNVIDTKEMPVPIDASKSCADTLPEFMKEVALTFEVADMKCAFANVKIKDNSI